jgi:subtilisin family serine protease
MTTYPFGTYAAGWGTSFSTPMVSGTVALMMSGYNAKVQSSGSLLGLLSLGRSAPNTQPQAANALAHTQSIPDPQMGHGRLDTYQAIQAWRTSLGLH